MVRMTRPLGHLAVVAGLLVFASLFLGPRIYVDQTLFVGDGFFYVDPSFRVAVPPGAYVTKPRNFLTHVDNGLQIYPQLVHVQTSLSRGEIPWWNPYLGLGIPGVAIQSTVFEPVALVLGRVFAPPMVSNLKGVITLVVAGWGMVLFARALGVSRSAAVFAGVAFAFSGWTIAWLGRTNTLVEMWMPWLFWAAERLLAGGGARFVAAAALFVGAAGMGGHPQTAVHVLVSLAVYALWRGFRAGPTPIAARRLALLAAAVALGLAVAAVQLVPTAGLIRDAEIPMQGRARTEPAPNAAAAVVYGVRGDWTIIGRDLPTALMAVSPLYFGTPAHSTYWFRGYNMMEMMVYAGLVPLFFAAYAGGRRRDVPRVGFWLVLALGALGVAYALPVFNLVNYAPVIGLANNGRLRLLFRFALVVAAALGYDRFLADQRDGRARWGAWLGGFAIVVLATPVVMRLGMQAIGGYRLPSLSAAAWAQVGVVVVLGGLAAAAALRARRAMGAGAFRTAVIVLAFADMWWHFGDFNPPIPTAHVYPETPVVRLLHGDPSLFRVTATLPDRFMPPDAKLPYRLFDVDLFEVLNLKRYTQLQRTVNGFASGPDNTIRTFRFDPARHGPLLNLMNVKYVLAPNPAVLPGAPDAYDGRAGFRRVYDNEIRVYENLGALPRAFLVGRSAVVSNEEALARVTAADFDPRATVLLEDPASPRVAGTASGQATIAAYEANRVVVRTEAAQPAYLLLSETYHPGWRSRVDGAPAAVYPADFLFRAVHVPAGRHEVVFEFAPTSYQTAKVVSLAALAVVACCFAEPLARRAHRRQA